MSEYLFTAYTYLDKEKEYAMLTFYKDKVKIINTDNQKIIKSISYKEFQKEFYANTFYDIEIEN